MITVVSHIFNEEYLLPFWLEHHREIFDHGIIIDYCSTDRSVEIIQKFCPTWEVIKTKNLNADGTPNFKADYVDLEVNEIEARIDGYKVCLNTTEFFFLTKTKEQVIKKLSENKYYHVGIHNVMGNKLNFYPKNTVDFFKGIDFIGFATTTMRRFHRILHSKKQMKYGIGRHMHKMEDTNNNDYNHDLFFILWTKFYPCNKSMFKRKLQIQNNIPQSDKDLKWGHQHLTNYKELYKIYNNELNTLVSPINTYIEYVHNGIIMAGEILKKNNIYYSELVIDSKWGDNKVMLNNDYNLLQKTDFDNTGYKIFNINNYNNFLQRFVKNEIISVVNKDFALENYHKFITEEEHKLILNSMPYKKDMYPDVKEFSEYLEKMISDIVGESVKIFNDDLWFRICRPSKINDNDYNPCHRDVYLDFYRNIVNIYLPVVGSNEKSALTIQSGSHKWSESDTMVTQGGAFFKTQNKKYSVDAIVASKYPIEMIRPNPSVSQLMLFSPYLIHGCAQNNNEDTTRISLEVRFIRNDESGRNQEAEFNEFLKKRNWR